MTNDEFRCSINEYLRLNKMTITELSRSIDKPFSTVQNWVNGGIKRDGVRNRVAMCYPHIFSIDGSHSSVVGSSPSIVPAEAQFRLALKIELAGVNIASLSELLVWFIRASESEREEFRDVLGEQWREFLALTRAMTGQRAYEIQREEGSLSKWGL